MSQSLKTYYKEKVLPSLMETFEYKNIHEVPKILDWISKVSGNVHMVIYWKCFSSPAQSRIRKRGFPHLCAKTEISKIIYFHFYHLNIHSVYVSLGRVFLFSFFTTRVQIILVLLPTKSRKSLDNPKRLETYSK